MTRKDYVLIAEALRIAAALADDNPRFDVARFLEACGLRA